jgi:transposase
LSSRRVYGFVEEEVPYTDQCSTIAIWGGRTFVRPCLRAYPNTELVAVASRRAFKDFSYLLARRCYLSSANSSSFFAVPESLWLRVEPLLPSYPVSREGGRPRLPLRKVFAGILYVLRTGCQWKAMPREFGSGSAIHDYFQQWTDSGLFEKLWRVALAEYDELVGIDWQWQSLDGAMTKSPLGGEKNREKPDRSRQVGRQAVGADGRLRRPDRRRRRGRQCA